MVRTANYFQEAGLIQDEPHSIRLTSDPRGYILQIVLNKKFKTLPTQKNNDLEKLEHDIRINVFDSLNFRIEVCNENFIPINSPSNSIDQ